jgi:hypothetical protein
LSEIFDGIIHVIPKQVLLFTGRNILLKLLKLLESSSMEVEVFLLRTISISTAGTSQVIEKNKRDYTGAQSRCAFVLFES